MNVYDAANERLKLIFNDFDNVLVAFSCGKDSGIVLNMAYKYAKETGQLGKLAFYYEDYEADKVAQETINKWYETRDKPVRKNVGGALLF